MPKLDYRQIFGTPLVDTISERTAAAGVTVDGVLLKDFSAGIGDFSVFPIDERLHVAEAVNDGDVAVLIENSEPIAGGSLAETASLKFGFGGGNNAARIQAGKVGDFLTNDASFMTLSVTEDIAGLTEGFRITENSGSVNVGIGDFSSALVDEKLHVAEAVDGGDVAILIDNSEPNAGGSTDETVSLIFGFGGSNNIAAIKVSKLGDFVADDDSAMTLSVTGDASPLEGIRILGESSLTPAGKVRVEIGATPLNAETGVLQVVSERTSGGASDVDMTVENKAIANTRLLISNGSAGIFLEVGTTAILTIRRLGGDGVNTFGTIISRGATFGDSGTALAATLSIRGTSAVLGISPISGDAKIRFGVGGLSTWSILMDDSDDDSFVIKLDTASESRPSLYFLRSGPTGSTGRTGLGTAVPQAHLHMDVAANVSGSSNNAIFVDYRQALADLPAAGTPALISKWRFGSAVAVKEAAAFNVGKTNDYSIAANEDAFICWEVAVGGSLTEGLRITENAGVVNVGIGTFFATAVDEKLHVIKPVEVGDVAVLIENSSTDAATTQTASLKFGFGGINTAGLIQVGKINDFVASGDRDSFMAFSVLNGDVVTEAIRIDNVGNVGIGTVTPNAPFDLTGDSPGNVGGFASGALHITSPSTDINASSVITGHNSFGGNKQLWYLGSASSSNDNITLINRQNASLSLGTNSITRVMVLAGGDVGIGTTFPSAQLHVNQSSLTGAKPVIFLDQADVSEEMIEFATTIGVGNAIEAVGAKTLTVTHFLKCTITGVGTRYIAMGTIA